MRTDPLQNLPDLRIGRRVSVRIQEPDGPTDRIGVVTGLDESALTLEDRSGRVHRVARDSVRLARLVPTVARGRNPRHAAPPVLRALATAAELGAPAGSACWIARLCDLVDHLDEAGVTPLPGRENTREGAAIGASRGLVDGEWAAFRLMEADALDPLAAWAARRNARNVVVTSPLPNGVLEELGLAPLRS